MEDCFSDEDARAAYLVTALSITSKLCHNNNNIEDRYQLAHTYRSHYSAAAS